MNELENVIDSYNSTIAKSEYLKKDLSDSDAQDTEDLNVHEGEIKTRKDETLYVSSEDSENIPEENYFSTYRTFSCNECSLKTNSQEILLLHMKHNKHNNRSEVQDVETSKLIKKISTNIKRDLGISRICNVCESTFSSASALRKHSKLEHPGTKVFYCSKENCDYGTDYTGNLRMHMEGFHNQGQSFNCDLCQYKTKWKPTFLEHKRVKHGLYERKSKYFLNTKAMDPTKCNQCEHVASSQKLLVIHMRNKHREINAIINCDQCSFATHSQIGLDHHKRWIHSGKIVQRKFDCRKCEFSVSNKVELIVHRRDVHGVTQTGPKGPPKMFKCKHCSEQIRGREKLRKHQRDEHEIALKILKCWFCEYKTTSGVALGKHTAIEHRGAKYECSMCSFVTKKKKYVVKHMEVIHSSKDWFCDQCDKVCKNEHYLKMHKKRNHEERKYKCDKCNFTAIFQCILKNHTEKCFKIKRENHNEKPEKKEEFSELDNTEVRPQNEQLLFRCSNENCLYKTTKERYLKDHIKRIHMIKDTEKPEMKKEFSELLGLKQKHIKPEPNVKDENELMSLLKDENDVEKKMEIK